METRLIIAYALIALMIAFAIALGVALKRNRDKAQRRKNG